MTIDARTINCGKTQMVEYSRPGVPTAYLVAPALAAEVDAIRHEEARWRVITQVAILKRKRGIGRK